MARTADELPEDQQQEEEEEEEVVSEPDYDEVPYNPKNLPLGWDGKVRRLGISWGGGAVITLKEVLICDVNRVHSIPGTCTCGLNTKLEFAW